MERREKIEIGTRTTVKAIITGFVSYGIIASFIILLCVALASYFYDNFKGTSSFGLHITLPLMFDIFLYFLLHLICKVSTYDVFKKCRTNTDNYANIIKYLDIFFIVCVVLSILLVSYLLYLNLEYQIQSIKYSVYKSSIVFDPIHVYDLKQKMLTQFNTSKMNLTCSSIIFDIGLVISFMSLFNYQRKMLTKYNEAEKSE